MSSPVLALTSGTLTRQVSCRMCSNCPNIGTYAVKNCFATGALAQRIAYARTTIAATLCVSRMGGIGVSHGSRVLVKGRMKGRKVGGVDRVARMRAFLFGPVSIFSQVNRATRR